MSHMSRTSEISMAAMALSFMLVLLLRRRDFFGRAFLLSDPHQLQKGQVWKHMC